MIVPSYILTFGALLTILWQDSKYRAIHWLTLLALVIGVVGISTNSVTTNEMLQNGLFNLLFVGIQGLGIFLYFSFKKKKAVNPVNQFMGIGDVLFLLVICLAFSFSNFVFFVTLGSLAMVIAFLLLRIMGKKLRTIPMAGWLSIGLIMVYISQIMRPNLTTYSTLMSTF